MFGGDADGVSFWIVGTIRRELAEAAIPDADLNVLVVHVDGATAGGVRITKRDHFVFNSFLAEPELAGARERGRVGSRL